jgi:predicted transposase YbfD/YdcC
LAEPTGGDARAAYGPTKEAFCGRFLPLPNGIPRADPFARGFAPLAPDAFRPAFGRGRAAARAATGLVPLASDGKPARRAKPNTAAGCLTGGSAGATANRLPLGQTAVPAGSRARAALPERLRPLDGAGALGALAAAGCQGATARLLREQGGHYRRAVKGNQPARHAAVAAVGAAAGERAFVGVARGGQAGGEEGHGRHEGRYVPAFPNPEGLPGEGPGVAAVVPVNREREVDGKNPPPAHFSLTRRAGPAAEIAGWGRGHWGIASGLHGVRDVVFRGDDSRVREGHAGANRARRRRGAVSLPSGHRANERRRRSDSKPVGMTTTCSRSSKGSQQT